MLKAQILSSQTKIALLAFTSKSFQHNCMRLYTSLSCSQKTCSLYMSFAILLAPQRLPLGEVMY
jgi:hypothetical protein